MQLKFFEALSGERPFTGPDQIRRTVHLQKDRNNSKMKRMNGESRDREKNMCGLEKMDTAILSGYQLYHNYFRTHEELAERTSREVVGIKMEGGNKGITVIQNARFPRFLCNLSNLYYARQREHNIEWLENRK
jgi:hypothetical protein